MLKNLFQSKTISSSLGKIQKHIQKPKKTTRNSFFFSTAKHPSTDSTDFDFEFKHNFKNSRQESPVKKVAQMCRLREYSNDLNAFADDLRNLGFEHKIPAFAYSILIDQNLQQQNLPETLNILIDAFLHKTVLDVLLYEDVLLHFISADYAEGIPLVFQFFKLQFVVPSLNMLALAKEAVDRQLLSAKILSKMIHNFHFRTIDLADEEVEVEDLILQKQRRLKVIVANKTAEFYKSHSFPKVKNESVLKPGELDPIIFDDHMSEYESILEDQSKTHAMDQLSPDRYDLSDREDLSIPGQLKSIVIVYEDENSREKELQLMIKDLHFEDLEDSEDYSTDVDVTDSEEDSEDSN